MRLQLGIDPLHIGQGRNSCYFSAQEIQIVASEDISEKLSFQELINRGGESNILASGRRSYQSCVDFRSKFDAAFVGRYGAWFFTKLVLDAFLSPFFQDAYEGIDTVQAARETTIG